MLVIIMKIFMMCDYDEHLHDNDHDEDLHDHHHDENFHDGDHDEDLYDSDHDEDLHDGAVQPCQPPLLHQLLRIIEPAAHLNLKYLSPHI